MIILVIGWRRRVARVVIAPDRHRITRRKGFIQRLIQLAVDVLLRSAFARHRAYIGKAGANNKKARNTEVPTPPCSKLACPSPVTARMTNSGGPL